MFKKVYVQDIIQRFSSDIKKIEGKIDDKYVDNLKDYQNVDSHSLDWINPLRSTGQQIALDSKAKVLVCKESIIYDDKLKVQDKVMLYVENPKLTISKIANFFWVDHKTSYIHPSAVIDDEAEIDRNVYIDAGAVLGKCKIKKHTVIKGNVTIYDNVEIGENCLIQAGAVIGTDGLGCQRENDGTLVKFPHFAGVLIGNNVEIGANCQIAKGGLTDTIISDGCKINGLSFIAHNCILEENVWITGNTMLAGSVRVKKNSTIFSSVIVRDQIIIGESVVIGMGSVVTKNIPDGETWMGNPAKKVEK